MKIYIRPLKKEDALTSYKWRNDPDIWQFTGSRPDRKITLEIELDWIRKVMKEENSKRFAICLKSDDKYIGNVQLTNIENGTAEFHIFIGEKKYWGKDLGKQATLEMIKYGFDELRLKQIYLYVNPKHHSAIRVYEKCGFVKFKKERNNILMIINN